VPLNARGLAISQGQGCGRSGSHRPSPALRRASRSGRLERLVPLTIGGVNASIRAGLITSGFNLRSAGGVPTALLGCHISLRLSPLQPPGAASTPLTRFLFVASPTRALKFFFAKPEKTLDSWYSGHIICGSFAFL